MQFKKVAVSAVAAAYLLASALPAFAAEQGNLPTAGHTSSMEQLVEDGVISQDTYEAMTAYLQENMLQTPTDGDNSGNLEHKNHEHDGTATDGHGRGQSWQQLVSQGLLSQTTADAIEDYLADNQTAATHGQDLWATLLAQGIITQSEYDSVTAALPQQTEGHGHLQWLANEGVISEATAQLIEEYIKTTEPEATQGTNLWENLLTQGILSQEDYDAIQAALPQMGHEGQGHIGNGLFESMLEEGVLTQTEYDAIAAALPQQNDERNQAA